jgi:hypothetical protein
MVELMAALKVDWKVFHLVESMEYRMVAHLVATMEFR